MNELQISLLAIGFLVIAGVYGFNRIQERKHRRLAEKAFPSSQEDVLLREFEEDSLAVTMPESEHEDVLLREYEPDTLPEMSETSRFREYTRIEPVISETLSEPEERLVENAMPTPIHEPDAEEVVDAPSVSGFVLEDRPPAVLEDMMDYVIQLHPGESVDTAVLMAAIQRQGRSGKQVRWLGMNLLSGDWEEVETGSAAEYLNIVATLQLADRSGPIVEQDLKAFCNQVQSVADEIVAIPDFPDRQSALVRAAELDKFSVDVDVLIGVNVITQGGEAFAATKIRALAESAGMKLQPDNAFHFFDEEGTDLFSLVNLDPTPFTADNIRHLSTHGITFLFDVPKVADGLRVFNQMLLMAKKMAPSLGGQLVDDNRRLLNEAAITKIKQQLAEIYAKMEKQQITSGSLRALRLFS